MQRIKLTPGRIASAVCADSKQQIILRDAEQPGLGLRVTAGGSKSYVFQGKLAGQVIRMTLGDTVTLTLSAARDKAAELRLQIREGRDPRILRNEKTAADLTMRAKAVEAKAHSFEKLMLAYADYLKDLKRDSHRDVRSITKNHVVAAYPKIAAKPAAQVTPDEIADIMRALFEAEKGRTANKARSYVRAAFQLAKDARLKPSIPVRFKEFAVSMNPAAETFPDRKYNRADKSPLSESELITYWQTIKSMPGRKGAVLRLHLLTGGQRIAQLVRLLTTDIDDDHITLFDGKGRPGAEPRPQILPLIPEAKKALDEAASHGGEYVLSTDGGKTHIAATTLSGWAQDAVKAVIPGFTAKRLRSGVETLLSRYGVSKDIRGRLQSHGIAGVQDRHYDGHDYLPEKRAALMRLFGTLERKKAKVVPITDAAVAA